MSSTATYFGLSLENDTVVPGLQSNTSSRRLLDETEYWVVSIKTESYGKAHHARDLAIDQDFQNDFHIEDVIILDAEGDESIDAEVLFVVSDESAADELVDTLDGLGYEVEMYREKKETVPETEDSKTSEGHHLYIIIGAAGAIIIFLCVALYCMYRLMSRPLTSIIISKSSHGDSKSGVRFDHTGINKHSKLSGMYCNTQLKHIHSETRSSHMSMNSPLSTNGNRLSADWAVTHHAHYAALASDTEGEGMDGRISASQENAYISTRDTDEGRFSDTVGGTAWVEMTPGKDVDEIDFKDLELLKEIGQGAFGKVWKARWMGAVVAVKAVGDQSNSSAIRKEAELLTELVGHPHVCHVSGLSEDPHSGTIYIVTHFYEHGSIEQYFKKHKKVSNKLKYRFILEACLGIRFLHKKGVVHRDIAAYLHLMINFNLSF